MAMYPCLYEINWKHIQKTHKYKITIHAAMYMTLSCLRWVYTVLVYTTDAMLKYKYSVYCTSCIGQSYGMQ